MDNNHKSIQNSSKQQQKATLISPKMAPISTSSSSPNSGIKSTK